MTNAIILGTGPSLAKQKPEIERLQKKGFKLFGVNNTYMDFDLDVWIACDQKWHEIYSPVKGDFDKWHWDKQICERYGYEHIEGRWGDGPNKCAGLSKDRNWIAYGHSSAYQAIGLASSIYESSSIILCGYDMCYTEMHRHYFKGLSKNRGEYPEGIIKNSSFDGLIKCYETIAMQMYEDYPNSDEKRDGFPCIYNATEGSALTCFPFVSLEDL